MENVLFVLGRQPKEKREQILARGWMTQSEYHDLLYRMGEEIHAELQRRGIPIDGHDDYRFEA
jgi:hypothetical protein